MHLEKLSRCVSETILLKVLMLNFRCLLIDQLFKLYFIHLAGYLYEATGSYDMAFVIIGCVPCAALIPMIIGLVLKVI